MKKRYLKTIEDVLALKNTDTKIYEENHNGYYKFVKGTLCYFKSYNCITYFDCALDMEKELYILEEEPMQEATEADIGKLCWFSNRGGRKFVGILREVLSHAFISDYGARSVHCRPLTKEEIKEFMETSK